MENILDTYNYYSTQSTILMVQEGNTSYGLWFGQGFNPNSMILILLSLTFLSLLLYLISYKLKRWKKFKHFEFEIKSIGLDKESENTLIGLVRRFNMDDPIRLLFSARLFDELASREIQRVLKSHISDHSKQSFVNSLYKIRQNTYNSEWSFQEEISFKLKKDHKKPYNMLRADAA